MRAVAAFPGRESRHPPFPHRTRKEWGTLILVGRRKAGPAPFYGNGNFSAAVPISDTIKTDGGFSIAAGDFNHDKAPDLAIPIEEYGKVAILLNTQ